MTKKWIHDICDAAAVAVALDDLGAETLGLVSQAVGANRSLVFVFDDNGRVQGAAGDLATAIESYQRELFAEDPVQETLMRIAPDPPTVLTLDVVDYDQYLRSAAYNDFYRPLDMEHLIGLWLTNQAYGTPGMVGILLTRPRHDPPFRQSDVDLLRQAHPALHAVLRRHRRVRMREERATKIAVAERLRVLAARHGLTKSELRVLEHLAEGASNQTIAQALYVSLDTIKTHVHRILHKLEVTSRTQAALKVWRFRQ